MKVFQHETRLRTAGGLTVTDITEDVQNAVRESGVTEGIDALAEVSVRVTAPGKKPVNPQRTGDDDDGKMIWRGHGADTDIVVASVKAYLSALNRMLVAVGQDEVVREEAS